MLTAIERLFLMMIPTRFWSFEADFFKSFAELAAELLAIDQHGYFQEFVAIETGLFHG